MIEILKFTFQSIWHFIGVCILISLIGEALKGIATFILALIGRKEN